MFLNIFKLAIEFKIPRVIIASSVHADSYWDWKKPEKIDPY